MTALPAVDLVEGLTLAEVALTAVLYLVALLLFAGVIVGAVLLLKAARHTRTDEYRDVHGDRS